jgi:hypothetical protein
MEPLLLMLTFLLTPEMAMGHKDGQENDELPELASVSLRELMMARLL